MSSKGGERLRLWLERGAAGYHLRDAATGEPVRWEDPRLRVVPVAGVTFRPGNIDDADLRSYRLLYRHAKTFAVGAGKKFVVEAVNRLDGGFMASPAVAGGDLILRTKTHLYGVGKK